MKKKLVVVASILTAVFTFFHVQVVKEETTMFKQGDLLGVPVQVDAGKQTKYHLELR